VFSVRHLAVFIGSIEGDKGSRLFCIEHNWNRLLIGLMTLADAKPGGRQLEGRQAKVPSKEIKTPRIGRKVVKTSLGLVLSAYWGLATFQT
jgi:hypothetical protein